MNKIYPDARTALDGLLFDGMTIMAGGFGLCGIPENAIDAILEKKEILDSFFGLETSDGSNTETEEKISSDVAQLVQLGIGTEIEKKSEIKIGARSSKSNKRTKLRSLSNDKYRERPESDELTSCKK